MAALEDAASSSTGGTTVIPPPPSSSSSASPQQRVASRGAPQDEHGVGGMQLMMISSAFALTGHYDEELMDLIGRQVIPAGDLNLP